MVSCHHEEALNYRFKHKRANKSFGDVDRVAQWLKQDGSIWVPIAIKSRLLGRNPQKVPMFSLTLEVDIESNRAYIASIENIWDLPLCFVLMCITGWMSYFFSECQLKAQKISKILLQLTLSSTHITKNLSLSHFWNSCSASFLNVFIARLDRCINGEKVRSLRRSDR